MVEMGRRICRLMSDGRDQMDVLNCFCSGFEFRGIFLMSYVWHHELFTSSLYNQDLG